MVQDKSFVLVGNKFDFFFYVNCAWLFRLKTPNDLTTPTPSETSSWTADYPDMDSVEEPMKVVEDNHQINEVHSENKEEVMPLPKTPTIEIESEDETVLAKREADLDEVKEHEATSPLASYEQQLSPPQLSPPHIVQPKHTGIHTEMLYGISCYLLCEAGGIKSN